MLGTRLHGRARQRRFQLARAYGYLCQAEVQNLGMATPGHEDIRGLDVAMDNSFGVGGIETVGDFNGQVQDEACLQRRTRDAMLQRHSIQKFHGNECLPVLIVNFVDRADIRMVQR